VLEATKISDHVLLQLQKVILKSHRDMSRRQSFGIAPMGPSLLDRLANKIASSFSARQVVSTLQAPIASISFDDIPHSAARIGAPILEAAGLRGTYYMCGGHSGQTFEGRPQHEVADLIALAGNGHEIACHTFGHPNVVAIDDIARAKDADLNADFVTGQVGAPVPVSFAYPFGRVSGSAKAFYASRFTSCRGVYAGVNSGTMDFSELRAVGIESRSHDMGRVRALIEEAKTKNGWLIFFSHDVGANPTAHGCTPRDLEDVIGALADARIETVTVAKAAAQVLQG
jgi:peptidoglycan/xylan/chitin deacetylase (PgdA/CDA1 family)